MQSSKMTGGCMARPCQAVSRGVHGRIQVRALISLVIIAPRLRYAVIFILLCIACISGEIESGFLGFSIRPSVAEGLPFVSQKQRCFGDNWEDDEAPLVCDWEKTNVWKGRCRSRCCCGLLCPVSDGPHWKVRLTFEPIWMTSDGVSAPSLWFQSKLDEIEMMTCMNAKPGSKAREPYFYFLVFDGC